MVRKTNTIVNSNYNNPNIIADEWEKDVSTYSNSDNAEICCYRGDINPTTGMDHLKKMNSNQLKAMKKDARIAILHRFHLNTNDQRVGDLLSLLVKLTYENSHYFWFNTQKITESISKINSICETLNLNPETVCALTFLIQQVCSKHYHGKNGRSINPTSCQELLLTEEEKKWFI